MSKHLVTVKIYSDTRDRLKRYQQLNYLGSYDDVINLLLDLSER